MVKLSRDEVLHVAKLANLELSNNDIQKFCDQLSKVIEHMGELSEVDTSNIEPTSQTTGLENIFRPDEVKGERILSQDQALSGSDKINNGYFIVGAILTERSDK